MLGLEGVVVTEEYLYVARIAGSLMLGWTFLLIWAVFKPVERKGILLLTVFPVMCGLVIAGILAEDSGLIASSNMVPMWIINGIIIVVYLTAYRFAHQLSGKPE